MSITTVYSVFCDGCAAWVAQTDSVKKARAIAKSARWKRRRYQGQTLDLCPVCAGVPCMFGKFSECLVHESYTEDDSGVCNAVTQGAVHAAVTAARSRPLGPEGADRE